MNYMRMKFQLILIVFVGIVLRLSAGDYLESHKIAIVNQEQTYINKTYQECNWKNKCDFQNLSCRFLNGINDEGKEYYSTPEEAQEAVKMGKAWGALYFTNNFTDAFVARMALNEYADEETLDQSKVRVWLEASNQNSNKKNLENIFLNIMNALIASCGSKPRDIGSLFLFQNPIVEKRAKLAIFNNEVPYVNRTYQECYWKKGCKFQKLGCRYLDAIKDTLKEYYPTLEEAKNAVRTDSAWGALYITENFTDAFVARSALKEDADEETIDQGEIKVWLYTLNNQTDGISQKDLQKLVQNTSRELFNDCDIYFNSTTIPISFFPSFNTSKRTHNSVNYDINLISQL